MPLNCLVRSRFVAKYRRRGRARGRRLCTLGGEQHHAGSAIVDAEDFYLRLGLSQTLRECSNARAVLSKVLCALYRKGHALPKDAREVHDDRG